MGEKENEPFQFTFNGLLKVAFQGSRVTSDAGLILVRELDERLGLEKLTADARGKSRGADGAESGHARANRTTGRPDRVVLDMDSSESQVHGQQEGSAYNGHFESASRRAHGW